MADVWARAWPVLVGLAVAWSLLVAALLVLARREGDPVRLRDVLRLGPDVLRLVRRLARDDEVPRRARFALVLLMVYLASPVDVVPDVLPVVGLLDDALLVVLVLRWVARTAGVATVRRCWPGTPAGLATLERLAGLG